MEVVHLPMDDNHGISINDGNKEVYRFDVNLEVFDEIMEWLFNNTEDRFIFLGTNRIYFESSVDAVAFKLRWV